MIEFKNIKIKNKKNKRKEKKERKKKEKKNDVKLPYQSELNTGPALDAYAQHK